MKINQKKFYFQKSHGFTLMEMLITIMLFSFIMAGVYAVTAAGENSWQVNQVKIELQQEMRKAMDNMIHELRQAGDSSIVNVPADNTWYTTVTFRTPAGVSSGSINWNADTIQFVRGGANNEYLQRVSSSTKTICQDMQSLQFRRQSTSPDILEVAMQAQKNTVKGAVVNYDLNFSIQLRN